MEEEYQMKVLITGATGKLGSKIAEVLLQKLPADQIAVSVRNPEKAQHLKDRGVDVRLGDFDRPETLDIAFQGIDRLLIVSSDGDNETRIRQHKHAVEAAKRAGVGFIAYTSVANASGSGLFLAEVHRVTEEAIAATGIPYSFLRNNWYLENELGSIQAAIAGAPWVTSAATGKIGWATRQDYAEAAAAVLAGEGHENSIYELSGNLLTQDELVTALGDTLGKEVQVLHVDDAAYSETMKGAGIPEFVLPILVGIQQGIREGHLEMVSNDFEKLLGRPSTPVREALAELVK
jgi:NAD(P)H dehydrogenase (quinone)